MTADAPAEAVVFVDDDASMREALVALMQSIGMHAIAFGSVQEYLDAPELAVPHCLVLDVRMPGRSGLDLQSELGRRDHAPPIVFLTGHADVPMSVRAMKAGAIEFLVKPFRDQDLIDAIREGIDSDREHRCDRMAMGSLRDRYQSLTPRARSAAPCGARPAEQADRRAHGSQRDHGEGPSRPGDAQDGSKVGGGTGPHGRRARAARRATLNANDAGIDTIVYYRPLPVPGILPSWSSWRRRALSRE